jgi:hypothetical protein
MADGATAARLSDFFAQLESAPAVADEIARLLQKAKSA